MSGKKRISRESEVKDAVTVTEMAGMVGLGRSRFNELAGSVFLEPVYDPRTQRPYYTRDQQRMNVHIRRSGRGADGNPAIFYAPRSKRARSKAKSRKGLVNEDRELWLPRLKKGIASLGLRDVTLELLEDVVRELYPGGIGEVTGDLVRSVFVELNRRAPTDRAGR